MTKIIEQIEISGLRLTHGVITRQDEREAEGGFYVPANREDHLSDLRQPVLHSVHGGFAGNNDPVVLSPTLCSTGERLFYAVESERAEYCELRRLRRTCSLVIAGENCDPLQLERGLGMRLDIEPSAHVLIALFMKGGRSGQFEMQCRPLNGGLPPPVR